MIKNNQASIKLNKAFESVENSRKWVELWKKRWYNSFEKLEQEIDYLTNSAQYPEALNLVEVYISKYPDNAGAYAIKGRINNARGKIREAEVNFTKAISLDSENPDFTKRRADIYVKSGNFPMAVKDISNALKSDPSLFDTSRIELVNLYNPSNGGEWIPK